MSTRQKRAETGVLDILPLDRSQRANAEKHLKEFSLEETAEAVNTLKRLRDRSVELRHLADARKGRVEPVSVRRTRDTAATTRDAGRKGSADDAIDRIARSVGKRFTEAVGFRQKDQAREFWQAYCASIIHDVLSGMSDQAGLFQHAGIDFAQINRSDFSYPGSMDLLSIVAKHESMAPRLIRNLDHLSISESMEAIGKIEYLCRSWEPDYVIGVNAGGTIVARYLGHRLSLSNGRVRSILREGGGTGFVPERPVGRRAEKGRILLIDDISRTGRTMRAALQFIQEQYSGAYIQGAALVSTLNTSGGRMPLVCYSPAITIDEKVKLPWETHGIFKATKEAYFFGRGENKIAISKGQAEKLCQDAAT